jgi:hypothetical protein
MHAPAYQRRIRIVIAITGYFHLEAYNIMLAGSFFLSFVYSKRPAWGVPG